MAERFSLKDHLFNAQTVGQLAHEYAQALPHFEADRFTREALSGFDGRELMARLDWIADCIEAQIPRDFNAMAEHLEAAMPAPLDPRLTDDDFGQFIHAVPGILAVRHGLEAHRERAMGLLYEATQRFSMEFYIRPFLNRWPDETLSLLREWAGDANYHVRRLVSEGTRPKLPWAKSVSLSPDQTLPLLDLLQADPTRYVTRSVANHLNDISKTDADAVLQRLDAWSKEGAQQKKELDWMQRHALRTLIKSGHQGAMEAQGFRSDAPLNARLVLERTALNIGDTLKLTAEISGDADASVLVDYRIVFARPDRRTGEKVFKLKQTRVTAGKPLILTKAHKIKGDATTFRWHPGPHRLILQVNGNDLAETPFTVR